MLGKGSTRRRALPDSISLHVKQHGEPGEGYQQPVSRKNEFGTRAQIAPHSFFFLSLWEAEIHWQRHQTLHSADSLSIKAPPPSLPSPPTERHWESSSSIMLGSCIMHIIALQIRWERRDKRRQDGSTRLPQGAKSKTGKQHPGIIVTSFCPCV